MVDASSENNHTFTSGRSDSLLECLLIVAKLYNKTFSAETLVSGLPLVNHQLTPQLFVRAAERAGFAAKIVKRPLKKIPNLVLPVVLILKNNSSCLLMSWHEDRSAEIRLAESDIDKKIIKSADELSEHYSGYAIYIQPAATTTTGKSKSQDDFHVTKNSWFWGTLWRFRGIYSEVLLGALLINIFGIVSPLFVMNVYDRVVPNNAETTLWVLVTGVMIIYLFDLLLRFLRGYLIDVSGKKADVLIASGLFRQVLSMKLSSKPDSVGALANTLREFDSVRDFFTSATLTSVIDIPFIFIYAFLIYYVGGALIWVPLIAVPITLISAYLLEKPLFASVRAALASASKKQSIIIENISALEMVKSLNAEGLMQRKWEQAVGENASYGLKSRFLSAAIGHISYIIQQIVTVGIVVIGFYEINLGHLTLGGLIACSILSGRMLAPLAQVTGLITRYEQVKFALAELNQIMELPSERPPHKQFIQNPNAKAEIEVANVSFKYPGQMNKSLDGISFNLHAGEKIGILGRIGSGKTTLIKLLLNLYQPTEGAIYLDGIDIAQMDPAELRAYIGYVPQDNLLFAGNARDNIVMKQPWADDSAVLAAARLSGADNFIKRHPFGYSLPIGERGEGLSGGQRQAIAIARAFINDPLLILLDEPTSSMDDMTERELIIKLKEFFVGKTVLLATHKTSLLGLVDRIILMDKGKIVMDGPRDEVIAKLSQPIAPTANK